MIYTDIQLMDSTARAAVMSAFSCSSTTAEYILGEVRTAYVQGTLHVDIYESSESNTAENINKFLDLDNRFDEIDKATLAALLVDAWQTGNSV